MYTTLPSVSTAATDCDKVDRIERNLAPQFKTTRNFSANKIIPHKCEIHEHRALRLSYLTSVMMTLAPVKSG